MEKVLLIKNKNEYEYDISLKELKSSHTNSSARGEDILILSLFAVIERLDYIANTLDYIESNTTNIMKDAGGTW